MRTLLPLGSFLVLIALAGCSSGADPTSASGTHESTQTSEPAPAESSDTAVASTPDACELLTTTEAETLLGGSAGDAKPGETGGVPGCQWAGEDDRYVQVLTAPSSDWAHSLPEALRQLEVSGLASDAATLRKIRAGAALIEQGQDLDPKQACSLFSEMLELTQDQPPGTPLIVTVIPSRANPQAVTGQMCADGHFTSVLIADQGGLDGALPIDEVERAVQQAHDRSLA